MKTLLPKSFALGFAALLTLACGGEAPLESESGSDQVQPLVGTPFADRIVSFTPGTAAGFGQNQLPNIVLGAPEGTGAGSGSLHVLSLGLNGVIILEFTDIAVTDGPGVDLLVFENAFIKPSGVPFTETGVVAVSDDGVTWYEFPCASGNVAGHFPGCAGVTPVYSNTSNGVSPTDPAVAGGDGFDLSAVGLTRARFVRVRDSGANGYAGTSGGFDLDAVAVVNGVQLP
ncbi:cell surface protein [Corallococcus llansteffanensis]|uniref:Cell surface protein n=1 Tax=Corallococcus llansteffanensis TaxID=2316731 RepID=A0A3A8P7W2_9BACT|nr:cell surface protein [Corallococcus llansteffanensis]RKH50591.1 cell surface protein [Corallococcus llansteffanensis]